MRRFERSGIFFKACGGVFHKGIPMRYCAIQEYDRRYPIRLMYRALFSCIVQTLNGAPSSLTRR